MPGEIYAYTFTEGALPGGATLATAVGGVLVPHRPMMPGAFRGGGADVQALSSPDPQVNAANAVMARRRVRTWPGGSPVVRLTLVTLNTRGVVAATGSFRAPGFRRRVALVAVPRPGARQLAGSSRGAAVERRLDHGEDGAMDRRGDQDL